MYHTRFVVTHKIYMALHQNIKVYNSATVE